VNAATAQPLSKALQKLRLKGAFEEARQLIRAQSGASTSKPLQLLLHEHQDFWWQPIVGRRVSLRRRHADDAAFVRACWADGEFMRKFNRMARRLPDTDEALRQLLSRDGASIPSEAGALHWTIHNAEGPVGFVSATGISMQHKRCEFLIGFRNQPASAAPVEAAQLALDFLKTRAGMERLTAYFYSENTHAVRVARKFGFEIEGTLRGYVRDAQGNRSDLLVAGMLLSEPNRRLTKRLGNQSIDKDF
jgi:RimJ/RimL family protein N-acetyltransferase